MPSDIASRAHARLRNPPRLRQAAWAGVALVLLLLAGWLLRAWSRGPLAFDDAYMFWRYALHLREGLGLAWNPDGVPTYGLTSQIWVFLVLPFTVLPVSPGVGLQLASWLAGAAALGVMAAAVARHAESALLRHWPVALLAVALPLLPNPIFASHLISGMDTTLSLLAHAALVLGLLDYLARPAPGRAAAVGVLAVLAVLARPENGLAALGAPFLAWAFYFRGGRRADLPGLAVLPVALLGLSLLASWRYFGVPLPLSFYAKSMHAYAGFQSYENALGYLRLGMLAALPFLGLLAACLARRHLALAAALLLPVAATFLYLLTVLQVMGVGARYYIPFLPYLVIPAVLCLDAAVARGEGGRALLRAVVIVAIFYAGYFAARPALLAGEAAWLRATMPAPIPEPALPIAAAEPLPPIDWLRAILVLGDRVVAKLPPGTSIAASEVGYLGAVAPAVGLIDLVGLNDTRIARQGFSMDDLLARAPDLIWLPHLHYTGLRAAILGDARLYARYEVIDQAFGYGVAIRRDSRARPMIEAGLRDAWAVLYPRRAMTDYIVRGGPAGTPPQ